MELLKQFNVTGQSHDIIQESIYVPRDYLETNIHSIGIYIVSDKTKSDLWLMVVEQHYATKGYTYVLHTLEDLGKMDSEEIKDRYTLLVESGLFPKKNSHWISGKQIDIFLNHPSMLQCNRRTKIKALLLKIQNGTTKTV